MSSKRLGARLWKMPSRMMGRMKVTNLVRDGVRVGVGVRVRGKDWRWG